MATGTRDHWLSALILSVLVLVCAPLWTLAQQPFDISVPTGAILYRNATSCWPGWSELTAARGNYIVGRVASGTLATQVGTALTDLENRAVGQHNHAITDPGHTHLVYNQVLGAAGGAVATDSPVGGSTGTFASSSNTTGITINNQGSVAGTNAPYIALIVCSKN